jgi:hypothetical protein
MKKENLLTANILYETASSPQAGIERSPKRGSRIK